MRFKLKYLYNNGHLEAIRQFTGDVDNTTYWALNALNARGQPIDEVYGNGLWLQSSFKALTGQIATRQSGTGGSASNVQDLLYTWDTADNLIEREDFRQTKVENFSYDPLNRLTQASGPGGTLVIGYDAIGNITSRSDVGGGASWSYHATKKHAVTAAGGVAYGYDANGNMTSRAGATVSWTTGQQPAQINGGGYTAAFDYAPDRARWRQVSSYAGTSETTIYVGGLMEKLTTPSKTEYKHLIPTPSGFVQAIRRVGGYTATHYLAGDHLGSVDAVLNSSGGVMVRTSFAAFGARRDDDWNGLPSGAELSQIAGTSRRGFTGHEMLDNVGLIHMNGRVYDPALGRFMSADPFIDQALGPQGFNRYAYVGNNPLSYQDPSGYSSNRGSQIYSWLNGNGGLGPDQPPPSAFEVHIALYPAGPLQPPLLFDASQIFWGSNHTPSARPRPPAVRDSGPPALASCVSEMCDDANVGKVGGTSLGRMLTEVALPGAAYFNMGHEAEGQRRYLAAFGWYTAGYVEAIGTIATAGVGGLVAWPTRAMTVAARATRALPALDRTGKVHGALPRAEDLSRYTRDELKQLQHDLRQSAQERIRKTSELGPDRAHGQRQAAEQQLIIQIDKFLSGS